MGYIKTNERPQKKTDTDRYSRAQQQAEKQGARFGVRAHLNNYRSSAYKVRQVLDLVRDKNVGEAIAILRFSDREAARAVRKLIESAVANAVQNDGLDPEELYIASCFADEGRTMFRMRPRARGRAGRIRKRTCHITVVLERMPDDRLSQVRTMRVAAQEDRARRVAGGSKGVAKRAAEAGRKTKANKAAAADAATDDTVDDVVEEDVVVEDVVVEDADGDVVEVEEVEVATETDAEDAADESGEEK